MGGTNVRPIGARWQEAKGNFVGVVRQFHEKGATIRTYAKLTPDHVIRLLSEASTKPKVRELREAMVYAKWDIPATLHQGGKGDAERAPDEKLHFNIRIKGVAEDKAEGIPKVKAATYHVRCKARADGKVIVIAVTA